MMSIKKHLRNSAFEVVGAAIYIAETAAILTAAGMAIVIVLKFLRWFALL